jgi:hypothetical protein
MDAAAMTTVVPRLQLWLVRQSLLWLGSLAAAIFEPRGEAAALGPEVFPCEVGLKRHCGQR